ncbi:MAG TPA: hypothetical protein PLP65_08115 [Bacteroidales bacterium]|nr:hypothetical protein [Bacteroidales bacterium]
MINIFKKSKKLRYFLRNIEKTKKNGNIPYTLIIYGNISVDLQIFARIALKYFDFEYDNNFGFVIIVFFNKNKDNNELYLSRFKSNKYFDLFTMIEKDGNDNYILDCKDNIDKTEIIALDILKNVFDHKIVKTKNVTLY